MIAGGERDAAGADRPTRDRSWPAGSQLTGRSTGVARSGIRRDAALVAGQQLDGKLAQVANHEIGAAVTQRTAFALAGDSITRPKPPRRPASTPASASSATALARGRGGGKHRCSRPWQSPGHFLHVVVHEPCRRFVHDNVANCESQGSSPSRSLPGQRLVMHRWRWPDERLQPPPCGCSSTAQTPELPRSEPSSRGLATRSPDWLASNRESGRWDGKRITGGRRSAPRA